MSIGQVFFCKAKFSTAEIDIAWHGPWLYLLHLFAPLSQPLVCLKHFLAFPSSLRSPLFAGGLRATPGVARNAAKTFGSLKSLTLKFKALVLHNLDWTESSSIKVIGNHWDYLYLFVWIVLFSSIAMLWGLQGEIMFDSRTNSDEHIDWDACAHKREELRFCLMDFVFFPDSRLCCETHTHMCLFLSFKW